MVYAQRGETCTQDSHLFATDIKILLTSRLNKKKRFLEWAAYTLAQSKEFAKTGQRSLHDYFDQNAPKPTKEYIKNTEESIITRRHQTQKNIRQVHQLTHRQYRSNKTALYHTDTIFYFTDFHTRE